MSKKKFPLIKRIFDVVFGLIILCALLPALIIISVLIKIESDGPVLFVQKRIGINGLLFNIYKFRSMKTSTPNVATDKLLNPEKFVTRIGKILRKTSLDELPQLLNIIKGDMSFVGPRPALYNQYELIESRLRLGINSIKPGLTGYAQIMGRDFISDEQKVAYDKHYLENMSIVFDMQILFSTCFKVIKSENVKIEGPLSGQPRNKENANRYNFWGADMNFLKRMLLIGLLDVVVIACAVTLAYFLRFDFIIEMPYFALMPYVIAAHVVLNFMAFNWMRIYRRVWQYASIGELISIIKATAVSEIVFYTFHLTIQFKNPQIVVPRSIYILSWILISVGIAGSRLSWRMFRDNYLKIQPYHQRTLIFGAGKAGALIARELKHSTSSELYPVAFVDDDRAKHNLEVAGLPVLGGRDSILGVVEELNIQSIVIAVPTASKSETAKIIEICKGTKAKIQILPRVSDLISGNVSVNMIREVSVEDLLGRDQIQVDLEGIANYVTNQVVLVTGAGGSIGSELCRQVAPFNPKQLLLLGHGENSVYDITMELRKFFPTLAIEPVIADIQDRARISEIFDHYRPSVVFHAAAHKHVPLMEANPAEAVKNNIFGTRNLAECAHEYKAARFAMISTDKAVNPTSVMGVTKRVAELIVQGIDRTSQTKFAAVRFGNVLGSRGSVVPLFKQQIKDGGPVTVTHPDMVRYFMTIPEAVQLVIQAGALAHGGEVFVLDMGKPVKIADLAEDLIRLSGFDPDHDIRIIYTGIRPGEKLFEEILTNEEGIAATKHNRIFVGKPTDFSLDEFHFMVKKMEQLIAKKHAPGRGQEIKALLKQIVPTYHLTQEIVPAIELSDWEMAAAEEKN